MEGNHVAPYFGPGDEEGEWVDPVDNCRQVFV
mgnify:CR=1 FL=1